MARGLGGDATPLGKTDLKPWKVLKSQEIFAADPWLRLSVDQVRLPNGRVIEDYYQIHLTESVVIFAETADGRVIVERMYKHGVGKVSLVLPAGSIDDDEEPLAAAQRELLEETGYACEDWQVLGSFVLHGNYGCGKIHIFSARNVRLVAETDSGDLETIEVILMKPHELIDALGQDEMGGLGTVAAILMGVRATDR